MMIIVSKNFNVPGNVWRDVLYKIVLYPFVQKFHLELHIIITVFIVVVAFTIIGKKRFVWHTKNNDSFELLQMLLNINNPDIFQTKVAVLMYGVYNNNKIQFALIFHILNFCCTNTFLLILPYFTCVQTM